jgi:hypothetical protein
VRVTWTSTREAIAGREWFWGTGRIPDGNVVEVVSIAVVKVSGGFADVVGALLLVV